MPISRSPSPASPASAAAAPQSRSASCIFAAGARDGRLIHREKRFGDIGRGEVRRLSVVEALDMLAEIAGEKG
jgi:hypothetical protein